MNVILANGKKELNKMNKAQRIRYYTKYKARKQYDERRKMEELK